jgi:cytochrome P450
MNFIKKAKLPPGPKAKIPLGHLFSFQRNGIEFLKKIANEYGDIVHFKIGPISVVLLNHPDFIKEVLTKQHHNFCKGRPLQMAKEVLGEGLLTSEGEFHDRQSRLIQPVFHRKMLESYAPAITHYAASMMDRWEDGLQVDMMEEMMKLSTAIAGKTLFNADLEKEAPEINEALMAVMQLFGRVAVPFSEWWLKLPFPSNKRFFKAKARLNETIDRVIKERRQNNIDNGDLLSILLGAQNGGYHAQPLTDKQVRDEVLTLFLTAFDTTSIALTWTWYLLSQNAPAEAELQHELTSVLQGRTPTMQDIAQLRYTRMVLGESMRIFPPLYLIARESLEAFSIDRYVLPANTLILMSPYLIHHDSRFHPDPEIFNPHAWEQHSRRENFKYQYFPFGGGPRACIGQPFAWLEGTLVLAFLAQSWRMELVPDHRVELLQLINLRPKNGMMMTLHRRK